jgi:Ca2+-binding RTX toxin-like protein
LARTRFAPLVGLFATATLIVTVAVAQLQGHSGAVGANVADPSTASDVVDAGCSPGGSDCAKRISDTIRANRARPLKVTFGANSPSGSTFTFNSPIVMADNVALEGVNSPVVSSQSRTLARVGGLSNVTFRNFDIDLNRCSSTKNVFFNAPEQRFDTVRIANMRVFNGDSHTNGGGSCVLFASRGVGSNLYMSNVTADKLRRVVWFHTISQQRGATIDNMNATEFGYQALSFDGYVEDVTIEDSAFSRHAPNVKGSHIIAFAPAETLTEVKSRNVVVRNSLLEGWPDRPHIKIDGVTQPNGASGDLIAIRGTNGFLLENNIFRHGGEVGVTITAGSQNGVVRGNEVSYTDTTGIVIGNGNTIRVTNIDVYDNDLFQNSLDRNDELRPLPALSVWGVTNSCVVHNRIYDNTKATGLWVWNGHLPPHWPRSVFDMYITENTFSNNLHDFVQSSRPGRNFEPASSFGGTNWTSTFGAPDADGDGFGTPCASETDDNNPCEPWPEAPTCTGGGGGGGTTTTTAPPTTAPSTTTPPTTVASTTSTTSGGGGPTCDGKAATIVGTDGDDELNGTPGDDVIVGLGGSDTINGLAGNDTICAGDGDDVVYGDRGEDVVYGGPGNDELRGGLANDVIYGGPDNDVIKGGLNNDRLLGEDGDDTVFGNSGRDQIDGGPGADTLRGGRDDDTVEGGPGADYIAGNRGVDTLGGGDGDDTVLGGTHNDAIDGGADTDTCNGGRGRNSVQGCEQSTDASDQYDSHIDDGEYD